MKISTITAVLFYLLTMSFSYAQEKPLQIYSSTRLWRSDKTKTGSGFKFRNTTNVKKPYLFAIYKDHISLTRGKSTVYQIKRKDDHYSNSVHYFLTNSKNQYFEFTLSWSNEDNNPDYAFTVVETTKHGKALSVTRFVLKKIK